MSSELDSNPNRLFAVIEGLEIPEQSWAIAGLIQEKGITMLSALPKVGKTWFGLCLAICLAAGLSFFGRTCMTPLRVLYVLGEDGVGNALSRIDMLLHGMGVGRDALGERLVLSDRSVNIENPYDRLWVESTIVSGKFDMVVLDPLARFLGIADENSSKDMRPITNWIRKDLRNRLGVGVLLTHHTDKNNRGPRGTGDLFALVESLIELTKESKSKLIKVKVTVRNAMDPEPFAYRLTGDGKGIVLACADQLPMDVRNGHADKADISLFREYVRTKPSHTVREAMESWGVLNGIQSENTLRTWFQKMITFGDVDEAPEADGKRTPTKRYISLQYRDGNGEQPSHS